jgi:cytochrome c oxidase subunit III
MSKIELNMEMSKRSKINPQKFALWIACGSIIMMFVALTSAYIVRQAVGNWLEFPVPKNFYISTIVILLSSITLHYSYLSFKSMKTNGFRYGLILTFILAILFIHFQYQGWLDMNSNGIYLNGNPSGSFMYVISGLHAAHVLGGMAALIIAIIYAFNLKHVVNQRRINRFELVTSYWHFVGGLWVYLLLFLMFQR